MLGTVQDVMIAGLGEKESRHLKILGELDLQKPLVWGTKLKYKHCETWVQFKYEELPVFCYYCGYIGHNERLCGKRKEDLQKGQLTQDQYGSWLRAGPSRSSLGGIRGSAVEVKEHNVEREENGPNRSPFEGILRNTEEVM